MKTARAILRHTRTSARAPVWLFDLDNTLHAASHAIFPAINRLMTDYVARVAQVDPEQADRLRHDYTRRYGATLLGLLRHHTIDPHAFLREVHALGDVATLVRAERGLAPLLRALPGRKLILTNGPERYAREVLEALGIASLFERVIAIEQMQDGRVWRAKPDRLMLRRVLRRMRVRADRAILVEDTRGHLKRYKRLGLRTVWMVGHLPPDAGGFGRPHYVDHRIRSLKSLHHRTGSRRNPCGNPVPGKHK
jgi:pyrimidine 5'-nucleotidase